MATPPLPSSHPFDVHHPDANATTSAGATAAPSFPSPRISTGDPHADRVAAFGDRHLSFESLLPFLLEIALGLTLWAVAFFRARTRPYADTRRAHGGGKGGGDSSGKGGGDGRAVGARRRLHDDDDDVDGTDAGGGGGNGLCVEARGLSWTVRGSVILDGGGSAAPSTRFYSGTVTALLGPSGAGKTTYLRALHRHLAGHGGTGHGGGGHGGAGSSEAESGCCDLGAKGVESGGVVTVNGRHPLDAASSIKVWEGSCRGA